MQLLRMVGSFGSTNEEVVHLWKIYCLSLWEQSCVVSGLSGENEKYPERCKKKFCKLVLQEKYISYNNALSTLRLQILEEQQKSKISEIHTKKPSRWKLPWSFYKKKKKHIMITRTNEKYRVQHAITVIFRNSPILTMQRAF